MSSVPAAGYDKPRRPNTKDRSAASVCGAKTTQCANCGCNRREHAYVSPGVRLPCAKCGVESCGAWKPKTCESHGKQLLRNGRCKLHGGASLAGFEHPSLTKGLYSKVVPKRLATHYEAFLNDDEILSLRNEIALTRTYIRDNVGRSGRDEWVGPAAIKATRALRKAWKSLESASNEQTEAKAVEAVGEALARLEEATSAARSELEARHEFRELTGALERLERSENARVVQLYNMISAERAFALRHAETTIFLKALDEMIDDRELRNSIRRKVAADLAELARGRNYQALGAGGGSSDVLDVSPVDDPEAEK